MGQVREIGTFALKGFRLVWTGKDAHVHGGGGSEVSRPGEFRESCSKLLLKLY